MAFTTSNFIFFIMILSILYYIIPKKHQWKLLLIGSFIFYSIAGLSYLIFIIGTIISTYLTTIKISNLQTHYDSSIKENKENLSRDERKDLKSKFTKKKRLYLIPNLIFNFGVLAILKYADFIVLNINRDFKGFGFILPLGISFYTFQTMGYLIDIYRGKYKAEKNIFKLALLYRFFHNCFKDQLVDLMI